jgi:hypothetical protein
MAKRKLSLKQRLYLRKDLRQLLAQKKKQADILRAIAKKYGITTISARWYYHSIVRPARPSPVQEAAVSGRTIEYRSQAHADNATSLRIVHEVQSIAEKNFKRFLEAKKLIPKWQIYVKKEAALRKLESKVRSDLRAVSNKASALHRKIRALTSG